MANIIKVLIQQINLDKEYRKSTLHPWGVPS
jgi:hypothetical protein